MKDWAEVERGGSGVDAKGAIRCRDPHVYNRLRGMFSKEFMVAHWYVLERARKLPHELALRKVCKTCGIEKQNDFKEFQRELCGDQKLRRYTTADVCKRCTSQATSAGWQKRLEDERAARNAYDEQGAGLWEPKT